MHNFKPGDLALVVGGDLLLGEQVVIIKWIEPGQIWHVQGGKEYFLDSACTHGTWKVRAAEGTALKRPINLMPLRGDEQTAPAKREELTW